MPIGNVSRDSGPKRDNYRPPWVKDKDAEAPPPWTQKRLKPVEAKPAAETSEDAPAPSGKTLKPALKKQSTIKEKAENGVSQPAEDKLSKPPATKLQERSKAAEERASKFTKSALKSIETIPKLEDKLALNDKSNEKNSDKDNKPVVAKVVEKPVSKVEKPVEKVEKTVEKVEKKVEKLEKPVIKEDKPAPKLERPSLKSVRTIDDIAKEKSVTIVDKRAEKNGPAKVNSAANDGLEAKTSNAKPLNKTKTIDDKGPSKTNAPFERPTLRKVTINEKPNNTTNDKPANSINDKTHTKAPVADKTSNDKVTSNSINKNTKVVEKEPKVETKPVLKPVDKPKVRVEEKVEEKTTMATKPPAMEKTGRLPPRKPSIQKQPSKDDMGPVKKWRDPLHERVKENIDKTLNNEIPKGHTLTKNESLRSLLKPTPPPPPMPPMPPKLPPPPEFKKAPIDPSKLKKIEQLKSRPRRRPDWSDMMKEVEEGKKLKHVVCNDRSSPIITRSAVVKNKDQFIFESEKPTKNSAHNDLLKQISQGVKLKKTKTSDRSKPNLEGLRKFRRQMTIEEQVQKSMSQANLAASPSGVALAEPSIPAAPEEEEIDEMDDIDKVRDDLQSTKQLLAIELRNKEAQERENKRLLTRIQNLEAELARERAIIKQEQHKTVISVTDAYDERLVNSLKMEVEKTKENADNLEKQYLDAAEQRDAALTELEEVKRRNAELERKLEQALATKLEELSLSEEPLSFYQKRQLEFEKQCRLLNIDIDSDEAHSLRKSTANNNIASAFTNYSYEDEGIMPTNIGSRRSSHAIKSQLSVTKDDSFEEEEDSESEEEESEEKKQKRMEKEVRNIKAKIQHLKQKQDNMKRERMGYKMSLKNQQAALKEEKRKYKELKREVDKMAAMMKEVGSDDEEDDEDSESTEQDANTGSEEETETETEQDTESETESESEPEDAPLPKKKDNLSTRLKRHETRVNALKKGNALLQANVDRLKDDVLKQREESMTLQKELDSLIDDLE